MGPRATSFLFFDRLTTMPASNKLIIPLLLATTFALNACAKNNDDAVPTPQSDTTAAPVIEDATAADVAVDDDTTALDGDAEADAAVPALDGALRDGAAPAPAGGGLQLQLGGSNAGGFGGTSPRLMDGGLRNP